MLLPPGRRVAPTTSTCPSAAALSSMTRPPEEPRTHPVTTGSSAPDAGAQAVATDSATVAARVRVRRRDGMRPPSHGGPGASVGRVQLFSAVILVDARGWLLLQERDEHAPID